MSLNGRLKARAASFARTAYPPILGSLRRVLSERQLQRFILVCDRLKGWLLKEAVVVPSPSPMKLPPWIVDEMKALARIEPALYPSAAKLRVFTSWKAPIDNGPAQLYRGCLADFIEYAPDMVFLVPHLQRGGADLGILHHVRLCAEMGVKVTVVVTRDVVSPWLNRLPAEVRVVEFGRLGNLLGEEDRRLVLLRLLLQCPARSLHIINSQLAWELLERHGKTLTFEGKRIYASVFCDDLDGNAVRCGYASEFLPRSWMHLAGLLSDNRTFLQQIHERDGIPPELMHGLYFPASDHAEAIPTAGSTILWASRISPQKRPGLLYEIALALPEYLFEVHGEVDPACRGETQRKLRRLPNVRLHGRYDSFQALARQGRYAMLLYTSRYDGLPNILLEATAAGLPIVAPDVGGIAEFLNTETGYLVGADADAGEFARAIRSALGNPGETARRVKRARELLTRRHGWAAFRDAARNIPGYLPGGVRPEQEVSMETEPVSR
ncbi:TPA: glycosyltransferase family 4 protein [Pseudomonas aeruginosa]|nr:glycosyltransferase family 4 protein [Pseudomonas aeruginosa]